jgi:hypothetical protein
MQVKSRAAVSGRRAETGVDVEDQQMAEACMGTLRFIDQLKQRSLRREVRKNAARSEKTSHAGIIRIGFEGISQPHNAWSTPVSITRLKHCTGGLGKWDERLDCYRAADFGSG